MKNWNWVTLTILLAAFTIGYFLLSYPARAQDNNAAAAGFQMPEEVSPTPTRASYPILQGASPSMPITPDAAPPLYGETNGTIGPPSLESTSIASDGSYAEGSQNNVALALVVSFLGSSIFLFFRRLKQEKKNALWIYGSVAAAVLMIVGFVWGHQL